MLIMSVNCCLLDLEVSSLWGSFIIVLCGIMEDDL